MSQFKLIAITPLKGCSNEFSKKLNIGHPYQFYKNYAIKVSREFDEIQYVTRKNSNELPDNLYKLSNDISLSISSVIGKNGTGKSTLMELLYQMIYRLAVQENFYEIKLLRSPTIDLQLYLDELKGALFNLCDKVSYLQYERYGFSLPIEESIPKAHADLNMYLFELIREYRLDIKVGEKDSNEQFVTRVAARLKSKISDTEAILAHAEKKEKLFESNFNVSLIYEIEDELREIQIKSGIIEYFNFPDNGDLTKKVRIPVPHLEDFFYTISLNYSHHGLNSKVTGKWVEKLFHKNDAYRTPLVLNPMRHEGNFDINHEIKLSNERLMSTLIYDLVNNNENWILDKYKISSFIFTTKFPPLQPLANREDFNKLSYSSIIKNRYKIPSSSIYLTHGQIALSYLNKKIGKIVEQYGFLFLENDNTNNDLDRFLETEDSHITKKINQTTNYLLRSPNEIAAIWEIPGRTIGSETYLSPKELLKYIDLFEPEKELGPSELIEYALPGFFNIDFEFEDRNRNKIRLSQMSSGEQQMIFNVNAVMYHLYNLESVHKSKNNIADKASNNRPAYTNINIVLDEMELYYHPEMQRRFVADLVKAFENLRREKIQNINVCILTHSPFILSDLPLQNILRLTGDETIVISEGRQTFASNIHELLRKEFMLEKGFFGEYARRKIEQLITSMKIYERLEKMGLNQNPEQPDMQIIRKMLVEEKEFHSFHESEFLLEKECRKLISLVGEPVLYKSLMEFYSEVFPQKKKDFIDQQIEMLEKLKRN
ncbi:AAA family ATPase [Chryseobacterium bernardetii]|uniref:AAA family ATPase n=1 Tax=Chryseobacterium bernardetii TaxID=1241978 RepID=UPI001629F01E|nr:AAA family ATPase [Chryseobacterium bernardetii]